MCADSRCPVAPQGGRGGGRGKAGQRQGGSRKRDQMSSKCRGAGVWDAEPTSPAMGLSRLAVTGERKVSMGHWGPAVIKQATAMQITGAGKCSHACFCLRKETQNADLLSQCPGLEGAGGGQGRASPSSPQEPARFLLGKQSKPKALRAPALVPMRTLGGPKPGPHGGRAGQGPGRPLGAEPQSHLASRPDIWRSGIQFFCN